MKKCKFCHCSENQSCWNWCFWINENTCSNCINKAKSKIDFNTCINKLLKWENIKILCNKQVFEEFSQYNNQSFINDDWKQEFLTLDWKIDMKQKLKSIYLIS